MILLEYARDLVLASKTPLDEVRREQERDLEEKAEFLQASALKQLEARQKRAMSAASTGIVAPNVLDSSRMARATWEYAVQATILSSSTSMWLRLFTTPLPAPRSSALRAHRSV